MTDANKPANTPSQRVMKRHPSGKDHSLEHSLPGSDRVPPPEASPGLGEQSGPVGAPKDEGVTVAEQTTAMRNREGAVSAREGTATVREGAAGVREETASLREEASTLREDAS